jgi:hypothetical protein
VRTVSQRKQVPRKGSEGKAILGDFVLVLLVGVPSAAVVDADVPAAPATWVVVAHLLLVLSAQVAAQIASDAQAQIGRLEAPRRFLNMSPGLDTD